ncbi:MAG TPA: CRTAC1 family protein [Verrucomicrobiae bacterium]
MRGLFVGFCICAGLAQNVQDAPRTIRVPGETAEQTLQALEARKERQVRSTERWGVFHEFGFSDALARSGITFRHQVVEEAGKRFKPNHYDHGTALAAADVDADGKVDLFFVNQRGGNELWRNLGGGRFENVTERAGVALKDRICVGASFGDIDNDGLPDLFVTTVKMGNHLFRNIGGGRFEDISESAGIREVGHSSGAVFFDFNRDGLLDLFVCNVGVFTTDRKAPDGSFHALDDAFTGFLDQKRLETSFLYQNLGNRKFRNVGKEVGLEHREWTGDATFCDLEQTGFPGLYAISMSGRNAYYRNEAGKSFRDVTRETFGRTPWGATGLKFFDFDQDQRQDLFITDMHSDMNTIQLQISTTNRTEQFEKMKSEAWCSAEWVKNQWPGATTNFIFGNALFRNSEGGFKESSELLGAETYWPWGISVGDVNADGFEDAFVTAGMGYPLRYGVNSMLLNDAGKRFLQSEFVLGVEPRPQWKVLIDYFMMECDGADKGHPFCQGKGGKVVVQGSTSSRSSLFADVDDDGDLDLVVNNMNDVPLVLASNLSEKRPLKFMKIRLRGTASNRDGLGATVRVITPTRTLTQFHDGKSGYLSQSALPLYFGLGDDAEVSRIEVLWPSGIKQSVSTGLAFNRVIEIVEARP